MSDGTGGSPAEGWYADPSGKADLRWWDGTQWTEHTHSGVEAAAEAAVAQPEPAAAQPEAAPAPEPAAGSRTRTGRGGRARAGARTRAGRGRRTRAGRGRPNPSRPGREPEPVVEPEPVAPAPVEPVVVAPVEPVVAQAAASATPADWYPDPHGVAALRYWDGERWTDHVSGAPAQAAQPAQPVQPVQPVQAAPVQTTPPGWYPDPYGTAAQRWWDGAQWTQQTVG